MEIHIDTSLLNINRNQNTQLEEITLNKSKELEEFVNKQNPEIFDEYLIIDINKFILQNNNIKSLTVLGKISLDKQSTYQIKPDEFIIVYVCDPYVVNQFLGNFTKFIQKSRNLFKFYLKNSLVIKYQNDIFPVNKFVCFIPSLIKVYFSLFQNHKFNKWSKFFINTENYLESLFIGLVLKAVGYSKITIGVTSFNDTSTEMIKLFDFLTYRYDFAQSNQETLYNHIIDTKGDFLIENRLLSFSLLGKGGQISLIDFNPETTQLDPHDMILLNNKSSSLNFVNIVHLMNDCETRGKINNFVEEILLKLDLTVTQEKLNLIEIKVWDKEFSNINKEDLFNLDSYLNLYILN